MSISNRPYAKDFFDQSRQYMETIHIVLYPYGIGVTPPSTTHENRQQRQYYGKYASSCALLALDCVLSGYFQNKERFKVKLSDLEIKLAKSTPIDGKKYVYLFAKWRSSVGDYYITYTLTEIIWE